MNKPPMDENRKWSRAALRIFGETLRPEEVGTVLGLTATRTHLKGERVSPRYKTVRRESLWYLQSPLSDDSNMADHLNWLLDSLEPKLAAVRTLSEKYRIDFFCGFSSGHGQGGFTLASITLTRIAKFGIRLVVDLYPPTMEIDEIEANPA